jgi:uncharacterized SAM-dependent methyltransferase
MQYFKNSELAKMYNVSQAAVGKWITSAKSGKLDLVLTEHNGKFYITNTAKNLASIKEMVKERKKYFNKRSLKEVTPSQEFYDLYNREQILDIISNLDIHREIPLQYTYFNGGAAYWDEYAKRLAAESNPNLLNSTVSLLHTNREYIDTLIAGHKSVNIIDVGLGNAYPVRGLLGHLLDKGVLGRYIGIDTSQEMLDIAERNIVEWFGGQVKFEGLVRDINFDRFVDIIATESFKDPSESSINIVLLFGGTLNNFRSPSDALKVIANSMGSKDLVICAGMLDTESTRLYFDFSTQPNSSSLSPRHSLIPNLLNIDKSFYTVEQLFDEKKSARFIRSRLKVAVSIKIQLDDGERQIDLAKGDTILHWRHWHFSAMNVLKLFDNSGLNLLHLSETPDHNYYMLISDIKTA